MKRAISFFLCLIMCFSVFSSTAVNVAAIGAADKIFTVKSGTVKDGKITYTVSLSSGVEGFGGAVILIEYDNTVLSPVEFSPAYTSSGVQLFNGIYVNGLAKGYDNVYSVGYTNTTPEKVSKNTEFFKLTFEVIDEERPTTFVEFKCKEFFSTTDSEQSITVADGVQRIARFEDICTLEVPKPESATLFTDAITFKWRAVVGATQYEIRRKTLVGTWEILAKVTADNLEYTDYNLESGNTYVYSVKAINAYDSESLFDSTGVSCKYISKPANITAESGIGGIEVTWEKTNGVDKYQVVRRELGTEVWSVIAEPANSKTSYKDTTVENGKTYEYDVNSVLGSFVTDTLDEGQIVTYLISPANIKTVNISDGVELSWDAVENAPYYVIYRKSVSDGETELTEYTTVSTNYFIDRSVENGKIYTYSIQAVGNYGDRSAFTKAGYTIIRVPTTVVTEIIPQANGIKVSWKAAEGVDGYYIYRRTETTEWEKAGSAPKTSTVFEDKGAKSGQTYFYCVAPCIGNSESAKVSSFNSVYFLKAPQNVTGINTKDAIKVSWSASVGATEYRVYRQDGLTTASRLVATVDAGKTEFVDTDVIVDGIYYYYVKAINETKGESLNSDKTPAVKRIECVEKIKTEIISDGVMVSWREHPYADSYIICRKNNDVWTEIAETIDFEYIDKTVVSGEIYAYSVIPVVGEFIGGIDEESIDDFKYLAMPTIKSATLTSDSIKIYWEKVAGAKTYKIQKAPLDSDGNRSGSYKTIATVNADKSSYEDKSVKAGKSYIYRMYAMDGETTSLVSVGYKATFLARQKIQTLSNAYGGVKITWNGSAGATKYLVYRKESGGDWVYVKKLSSSKRSYVDKGAKNGVKTYYAVKAQNGDSISTYKSKSFTYFASPKATVSNKTSAITVSWDKISGAKSYYVYRIGPGDKSFKHIATVTKNIYTDKNVKAGKNYKYTVKAYNGKIFSGYNTDGWKIKRLSAPELKSIKNSTKGVILKWGKVTGASKYVVMRKQRGSSTWEELITTTSLEFTDKTAKAGKIYTYTVKAGYSNYRSTYIAEGLKIKRLSRPTLASVKSSKSGITFKWKEVTGASGYLVYRKTGSGSWEQIAKVTGANTTTYFDRSAKKGKTYYYSVRAYSGSYKSAYNTSGLKIKDKY